MMNFVITMAGKGSRFVEAGFPLPKPLIDVLGKPMYSWAVDSLPLGLCSKLIFVVQQEHIDLYKLDEEIRERYHQYSPQIIALNAVTSGQAETVLLAKSAFIHSAPLVVFNSDTFFEDAILESDLKKMFETGIDGVIQVFEANSPNYSYVKIDAEGYVVESAEKIVISNLATSGLYAFADTSLFCELAKNYVEEVKKSTSPKESYIAPLYNEYVTLGKKIIVSHVRTMEVLGTPQELNEFLQNRS